jgi:hypothetical protein
MRLFHAARRRSASFLAAGRSVLQSSGSWLVGTYRWLCELRPELWHVEGMERNSGLPLSILCAVGAADERSYILQRIFGDSYRRRCLGRSWLWALARAVPAAASDCSLIVAECDRLHRYIVCLDGWYLIPQWVLGEVTLPYEANLTSRTRSELRRQMKPLSLRLEVSHDLRDFDDFFHNMHMPFVTGRFGDSALVCSYRHMKAAFKTGDLVLIKNQDETVAGGIVRYFDDGPYLWEMGIRDGDRGYLKEGVGTASYHLVLKYLEEKGYKNAFMGGSRAFLNDGVLRHKKKWSQRIVGSFDKRFAVRILSRTPAVTAFLCNNPFIAQQGDDLCAAVFVNGEKPLTAEEIQRIDKDCFHPGLKQLFIYDLRPEHTSAPSLVPADLAERVKLNCVTDSPARIASG